MRFVLSFTSIRYFQSLDVAELEFAVTKAGLFSMLFTFAKNVFRMYKAHTYFILIKNSLWLLLNFMEVHLLDAQSRGSQSSLTSHLFIGAI